MKQNITTLSELMDLLRDPKKGCAWTREQTLQSLIPYTIEEAYEVADAIDQNDKDSIKQEVADLLLQVGLYTKIASEEGLFDWEEVIACCIEKQLNRNPDLNTVNDLTAERSFEKWQQGKFQELLAKGSVLDDIAKSLPALIRATKLQERAAMVGFDWPDAEPVFTKVQEELAEVKEAIENKADIADIEMEIGDLLFSCVNLARKLSINPEAALRNSNQKFIKRFQKLEEKTREKQYNLAGLSLVQLEALWQEVKNTI